MVAKNLPKGASETVHIVAFTPTPRLIQLEFAPEGEQKVLIGELGKTATHYVLKPRLGPWLKFFATLLGRAPPDSHAWIVRDDFRPSRGLKGRSSRRGQCGGSRRRIPAGPTRRNTKSGLDVGLAPQAYRLLNVFPERLAALLDAERALLQLSRSLFRVNAGGNQCLGDGVANPAFGIKRYTFGSNRSDNQGSASGSSRKVAASRRDFGIY